MRDRLESVPRIRLILPLLAILLAGTGLASIGEPPAQLLEELSPFEPVPLDDGYLAANDFSFDLQLRNELVEAVNGEAVFDEENIDFMAQLVAAATGYGDSIAEPVHTFLSDRLSELSGRGAGAIAVEQYRLTLEVSGDQEPYRVAFELELQEIPAELFPPAAHSIGPADARFVIREFSDLQCPFCATFAATTLPRLEEGLLERDDVRFEFHHFPLKSIHANALPAAEAAECVTAANEPEDFWTYHDALFERQRAWQGLGEPEPYFVRLAGELGLDTTGVEACLEEGRYRSQIDSAYATAAGVLGLNSTPTLFVNGYRVQNHQDPQAYAELIELIEAFDGE